MQSRPGIVRLDEDLHRDNATLLGSESDIFEHDAQNDWAGGNRLKAILKVLSFV
jgi:hypothetical protein